jgi:UDPglucose--hexose-1-phosphate uridylyltransferase
MQAGNKMIAESIYTNPHRRFNPLVGEWLLLSPHRTQRPWQGRDEDNAHTNLKSYDNSCYLCPGNVRANGVKNENYSGTYVFTNDFSSLMPETEPQQHDSSDLFKARSVTGACKVICFSDRHDLTLAHMDVPAIQTVIQTWMDENISLGKVYPWVQIFENKGEIMGCSNPHPHGQIWSSDFIPKEPSIEDIHQKDYFRKNRSVLLLDYLEKELQLKERVILENETWVALVPYWATWPFEIMLLPKQHTMRISDLDNSQKESLALIMKEMLVKYDNIFETFFPYSMGWHGAPFFDSQLSDLKGKDHSHWQLHAHFYPPLLRSATIKKFMVGYEMLGCAQRDITPETAASILTDQPNIHYSLR